MRRGFWLPVLFLALLASTGCVVSTVNHLWATRNQFLKFDQHIRYEPAAGERGPALRFLNPRLTRDDVRAVASERKPTTVRSLPGGELWTFRWQRLPRPAGPPVNLQLEFSGDLLTRIRVDKRFADHLGDGRIEMLVRQFVGPATDLDLFRKRVWCRVPGREASRFTPLTLKDMHALFGEENLARVVPLPKGEPSHIYRYQLEGVRGDKSAMSFGASFQHGEVAVISSRIGSFSLAFDFTGE